MEFIVENCMDRRQLALLNRVTEKTVRKWTSLFFRIGIFLIGLYLLLLGGLMVAYGSWKSSPALALLSLLWGVLMMVCALFSSRVSGILTKWRMLKGTERTKTSFEKDGFTEETAKASSRVAYSALMAIYHYQDCYFLFLDKKHGYILPESGFVRGSAEAFPAFLERRTGKTVRYLK